jgi:hypothetical protein
MRGFPAARKSGAETMSCGRCPWLGFLRLRPVAAYRFMALGYRNEYTEIDQAFGMGTAGRRKLSDSAGQHDERRIRYGSGDRYS